MIDKKSQINCMNHDIDDTIFELIKVSSQGWATVRVAANDGHQHWSVPKQFFSNSSAVLLRQVGWIDCLVSAYLGDFFNLDLMF
jgi:hypothetical protein